jgi:hypothetical protein
MRQIQMTKVSRTRSQRRAALLDQLPLDPRDPDIAKAKELQRNNSGRDNSERDNPGRDNSGSGDQGGHEVGGDR